MRPVGRIAWLAALIGVALSIGVALAQGPGMGPGGPMMGGGGPPPGPPPFMSQLYPPKLVMEHQSEIALRPAQAEAIKQAMGETQQKLVDLQWKLDAGTEAITQMLSSDHVDQAAVLAKLDEVLATEQQVKRLNFALLVEIKNQLDADQQAKLRALRAAHRPGQPGPHQGGPPGPPPE